MKNQCVLRQKDSDKAQSMRDEHARAKRQIECVYCTSCKYFIQLTVIDWCAIVRVTMIWKLLVMLINQ
jgi:hypothetical protein